MSEAASWPPGWFRDPTGRHDHRWWDGAAWTGHVADAGTASVDMLTGVIPAPGEAPNDPHGPVDRSGASDRVAITALVIGISAVIFAVVPGFGLVLPTIAIVLSLIARARIRTSGLRGDGLAIGGLVTGIGALLIALIITALAGLLLAASGGELAGAFAEYVACLEARSPAECEVLLEETLSRLVR